jgi:hypothetical protein
LDDSFYWLNILKNDQFYFFQLGSDRFSPLNGFSQQIISYYSFSPIVFFLYNFIIGICSICILVKLISYFTNRFKFLPILIIVSPGFTYTHYLFFAGEPTLLFFWCVFILSLYKTINQNKSILWILISFLSANIALYHKETGFVILIVFSISYLFFYYFLLNKKNYSIRKDKKIYITFSVLIASGFIYFALYIFSSMQYLDAGYLNALTPNWSLKSRIVYSLKSFILYVISDPIITIILPYIFVLSIFERINKSEIYNNLKSFIILDSLSISVIVFFGFYTLLGIHAEHYLLPSYPFAIIAITGYLSILAKHGLKIFDNRYKIFLSLIIIILITNGVFSSFNQVFFYRASSRNFMQYKDALIHKINDINLIENNRINFYLPGIDDIGYTARRHQDILNFYEVDTDKIKFAYNKANQNWLEQNMADSNENFVQKGDFLLIRPNSTISQDEITANLQGLKLREIMRTQSPYYFEIPEIRHMLKYIMLKKNPNALDSQMIYREVNYAIYEVL